ncbi:MAG: hypothetical protein LQ345_001575 [Seirophora villosa]|nr:MAG: hypothetical protein LQ345_001575 [Seirophora villosa]
MLAKVVSLRIITRIIDYNRQIHPALNVFYLYRLGTTRDQNPSTRNLTTEMKSQEIQEITPTREQEEPINASFRFNDLPTELQLIIIHHAIPQHGLVPFNSPRLRYLDDWKNSNSLPSSLFRVNKMISAQVQALVQKEAYLVINVTPGTGHLYGSTVSFLKTQLLTVRQLPSHLAFANVGHFQKLRNFELDLMSARKLPWKRIEVDCTAYKERFRLIGDILSTFNDDIQHLTINLPCLCGVDAPESVEACILDFLAPLRRLRVAKPVAFRADHTQHKIFCKNIVQDDFRTERLLHILEEHFGRLTGEELSFEEAAWRYIKAEDRTKVYAALDFETDPELRETEFGVFLYLLDKNPEAFQRLVSPLVSPR